MAETTTIQRNSKGLVDALFNAIDALNARQIEPEHARAISHTAKTIVGVAALELEVRKFQHERASELEPLKSLAIEDLTGAA